LAEVLLAKLPPVLRAARAYADRCLADLPPLDEREEDEDDASDPIFVEVDGRPIPYEVFRAHVDEERGGAATLSSLNAWTLPTVAALTRDRARLLQAVADEDLCQAARAMANSEAHWLDVLLGVELDATWLVACPIEKRAFVVRVDGVVSNFDLHALVSDVLIEQGIAGEPNPPEVMAFIRNGGPPPSSNSVSGSFQFYTKDAGQYDWGMSAHPAESWVWGEGRPDDVPFFRGMRTLVVGPSTIRRSWGMSRTFSALSCDVSLVRELPHDEAGAILEILRSPA
jgi:hypothetical protein